MYSGNNNSRKLLLCVLLLAAVCIPALHAQNAQIGMDVIERGLYSSLSYVPQNEYHRVFQNFVKERYKGRTWLYEWEAGDFAKSFGIYVASSGVFKTYEAQAQAARQREAAAAEATRQREAAARAAEEAAKAEAAKYPHRLTTDTKLYAAQDSTAAVVAALIKGTRMQVQEYGDYTDLDGDTAKWARVTTSAGKSGWVFSGYLEDAPK
ncbi:hypothetical protein AGMMS49546_08870 [Spirochaetia bacterium]|nr:hypothetical protein AGMMS49546_08870 [Spirochaetia bacterium]